MNPWHRLPQWLGTGLFLGMILHSVHAENAIDPKKIKKNPRV